jgi:hypothetical protein
MTTPLTDAEIDSGLRLHEPMQSRELHSLIDIWNWAAWPDAHVPQALTELKQVRKETEHLNAEAVLAKRLRESDAALHTQEIARLREIVDRLNIALSFYADVDNYEIGKIISIDEHGATFASRAVLADGGKRAHEAMYPAAEKGRAE